MDQRPMTEGGDFAGDSTDPWPAADVQPGPDGYQTGPSTLPLDLPPLDLPVGDIATGTIPAPQEGDTTESAPLTGADRATWTQAIRVLDEELLGGPRSLDRREMASELGVAMVSELSRLGVM